MVQPALDRGAGNAGCSRWRAKHDDGVDSLAGSHGGTRAEAEPCQAGARCLLSGELADTAIAHRGLGALTKLFKKLKKRLGKDAPPGVKIRNDDAGALDLYAVGLLRDIGREHPLNHPHAILRLLRQSFAPVRFDIVEVKASGKRETAAQHRFSRLAEAMANLPPVSEATARRCARIADSYLGNVDAFSSRDADVAWHFARSSSNMPTGRVMAAAVRFMRPDRCLEIGTAYGFSAAVIASALERVSPQGRLLTIEVGEVQYRLASALLKGEFGDRVICRMGNSRDVLGPAAAEMAPIGFVFHDGGHSEENYVRDFETMLDALAPGGVVMFDDIRWHDRDRPEANPRCYEGWRRVVAHSRVERAIEVGPKLGLLMVS